MFFNNFCEFIMIFIKCAIHVLLLRISISSANEKFDMWSESLESRLPHNIFVDSISENVANKGWFITINNPSGL